MPHYNLPLTWFACAGAGKSDEYVCWTRMQSEAGQPLEAIVKRKERERRSGEGTFFWGIGNAPPVIVKFLARAHLPVRVVFSIMKSNPKHSDAAPSRTVVWRGYIDAHGIERRLPSHVLVTSRGDTASGPKRAHYALICYSDAPLILRRGEGFNPGVYRNAGRNGAPVGASQVTVLLRRVEADHGGSGYEANLTAWLMGSYWVRLTRPLEFSPAKLAVLADYAGLEDADWLDAVASVCGETVLQAYPGAGAGTLI
jgi:hypothetical protein